MNNHSIEVYADFKDSTGLWNISAWNNGTVLCSYQNKEKKLISLFIKSLHDYSGALDCQVAFNDGIDIPECNNSKIGACTEFSSKCFNYPCYQ